MPARSADASYRILSGHGRHALLGARGTQELEVQLDLYAKRLALFQPLGMEAVLTRLN